MSDHKTLEESRKMLAKLADLERKCNLNEPWVVVHEPHNYKDGTTHFTHVETTAYDIEGSPMKIFIGSYLSQNLAEFLVLLRNNSSELVRLARLGIEVNEQS